MKTHMLIAGWNFGTKLFCLHRQENLRGDILSKFHCICKWVWKWLLQSIRVGDKHYILLCVAVLGSLRECVKTENFGSLANHSEGIHCTGLICQHTV